MKSLTACRENLSLVLSMLVLGMINMNFVVSHRIDHPFELRFAVSGCILAAMTLYYRFLPSTITALHRALYRISAVMTFWAFGFFLFPTPKLVLYLITLPAFYFLYRIEVKKTVPDEDLIACGTLLALGTLLYILHQPLQVILFTQSSFSWSNYYTHAPVLILTGIGYLRLHRHAGRQELCLLGSIIFFAGIVLSAPRITIMPGFSGDLLWAIMTAHLFMLLLTPRNPLLTAFMSFTGLSGNALREYIARLWAFLVALMHGCLLVSLLHASLGVIAVPVSLWAVMISLYHRRKYTVALFLTEALVIFGVAGTILFPEQGPLWQIPAGAVLVICVVIKRKTAIQPYVPNPLIVFLGALYFLQLGPHVTLNLAGLVFILFPFICWALIPDRPLAVPRRAHWMVWPALSGIIICCLAHGYNHRLLNAWAMAMIIPPAGLFLILRSQLATTLAIKHRWFFIQDWAASRRIGLMALSIFSVVVAILAFGINYQWYLASWAGIWQSLSIFLTGIFIYFYLASRYRHIRYVMLAEFLVWSSLGLIRWKFDAMAALDFGTPADGYFLLAAAVMTAGIREVLRNKAPEFTTYFQKTTVVYGMAGWAYLQILHLVHTGTGFNYHGEISSVLMALLSFRFFRAVKKINIIYSFIFMNTAIFLFFYQKEYSNLMFYIMPLAGSALFLVQLFKDNLTGSLANKIRLLASLIMCGSSAVYNIIDFNASVWYPVIATLVSLAAVIIGVSLRIRIYLVLGVGFSIMNAVGVVAHIIINQPAENITLLIGLLFLVAGIVFTVSFLVFQMKRQQILLTYHKVMAEIGHWE